MHCGITGKLFVVIYNLYKEAKSCIKRNMHISEFVACLIGVRQGENVSPLLFSIFLHDIKKHLSKSYGGLQNIDHAVPYRFYCRLRAIYQHIPATLCG